MGLKIVSVLAAGALLGLCSGHAKAQLVGTYSGTQANGATISITVEQHNTSLYLSGVGIGIMTTCPDGEPVNENVGLGIEPIKIKSAKFAFDLLANPELYVSATMTFDNDTQSVSGNFTAYVPALDVFTKHPRKSETCISKQTFTATLGALAKVQSGSPRVVISSQ